MKRKKIVSLVKSLMASIHFFPGKMNFSASFRQLPRALQAALLHIQNGIALLCVSRLQGPVRDCTL